MQIHRYYLAMQAECLIFARNKDKIMNESEKRTVEKMIIIYCKAKHKTKDSLCSDCQTLNEYATQRLEKCRFGNEKPTCNTCPVYCYRPDMKERIKTVMRFSAPRMLYLHPIDLVYHTIKEIRKKLHKTPQRRKV